MRKRIADRRVGYYTERYTDYNANPQGVKVVNYIKRWRLEPKPEDMQRYRDGELVEPLKPITFYIDPATPKKWVPFLKQGVMDWQRAFERAGFKNAILALDASDVKDNASWSLEDSRHSAIVYKPSTFANAAGPIITDPRSGEILESHINWYHNLMSILHDWYMVQCGPVDKRAQRMQFDDELMGQLIRSVAAHEVGHALGLTHNFGASSTVPVENLRNKQWVEANGHTPSIMDYARFNYVAQPEDSISEKGLISHIGPYDEWAIEWGYRLYPGIRTPAGEAHLLNQWVVQKMKSPNLWFGSEFDSDDPRAQTEDLGDNAMKAGTYGIKNLKRVVPNLRQWTYRENEGYKNLADLYSGVCDQFNYYLAHSLRYIGGTYQTIKSVEQPGPVYEPVPVALQKEALVFLSKNVFTTPKWLVDSTILNRIGQSPLQIVSRSQEMVLSGLLSLNTFTKLTEAESLYPNRSFNIIEYVSMINNAMGMNVNETTVLDLYSRNLQRMYIDRLLDIVQQSYGSRDFREVAPVIKNTLTEIQANLKKNMPRVKDPMTLYHLRYVYDNINEKMK
jgi:hypothetical protein